MKLSVHSRQRIMDTFATWEVPRDFAEPMFNYLVHGYNPGSCFTGVLANDFYTAIRSSHPANTIGAFKALAGWIRDTMPAMAHGSYEAVKVWMDMESGDRREVLENSRLVYTAEEEMILILSTGTVKEHS